MALLNLAKGVVDLSKKVSPLSFDLSGFGFSTLSKAWMPQRKFQWQLIMPENIDGIVGVLVSQYCQDVRFGDYSISQLSSMQYAAWQRFYAGLQRIRTASFTFVAPADNSLIEYFYGWYRLMIDDLGYYYPKSHYKKRIYVSLYDRTGIETVRFTLLGVFPTNKPVVDLSYSPNELLRYTVNLSVDEIEMYSLIGSALKTVTKAAGEVLGGIRKAILG